MNNFTLFAVFTLAGAFAGTLVEYVVHRFVVHSRRNWLATRRHRMHHKTNHADSVWADFRDFLPWMVPVAWVGFLFGVWAGLGFLLGCVAYVLLLALVHTWSHDCPQRVFWMRPNAHELHHARTPRANFGVTTSLWDHVFGTYRRK